MSVGGGKTVGIISNSIMKYPKLKNVSLVCFGKGFSFCL